MEAHYRCSDMELWRRDVGVGTWRHGGMELWRLATGVATKRHGDMETRENGGMEARCTCSGMEARSSGESIQV